jgi:hypothetical protein
MECLNCKATNPEGKRYCGDCGTCLDPNISPIKSYLDVNLRSLVEAILADKLKDQKVVETEIAEAVVTKMSNWTKLLGFFVGIPLGLIVFLLGFLGIKSYVDLNKLVSVAREDAEQKLQRVKQESDSLMSESQKLRSQLTEVSGLADNVKDLSKKVELIGEKIGFEPSTALTSQLKTSLETSLLSFQKYLQRLGYRPKESEVRVFIDPDLTHNPAEYSEGRIKVVAPYANDTDIVFREYTFHVLSVVVSQDVLSGRLNDITSGLADYFPCSFNNDPVFAEKSVPLLNKQTGRDIFKKGYVRNLNNDRKFTDSGSTISSQDEGEVWGAAFWEIRVLLGQTYADKILFSSWAEMKSSDLKGDHRMNFLRKIIAAARTLENGKYVDQVRTIFGRRGLNIS